VIPVAKLSLFQNPVIANRCRETLVLYRKRAVGVPAQLKAIPSARFRYSTNVSWQLRSEPRDHWRQSLAVTVLGASLYVQQLAGALQVSIDPVSVLYQVALRLHDT